MFTSLNDKSFHRYTNIDCDVTRLKLDGLVPRVILRIQKFLVISAHLRLELEPGEIEKFMTRYEHYFNGLNGSLKGRQKQSIFNHSS